MIQNLWRIYQARQHFCRLQHEHKNFLNKVTRIQSIVRSNIVVRNYVHIYKSIAILSKCIRGWLFRRKWNLELKIDAVEFKAAKFIQRNFRIYNLVMHRKASLFLIRFTEDIKKLSATKIQSIVRRRFVRRKIRLFLYLKWKENDTRSQKNKKILSRQNHTQHHLEQTNLREIINVLSKRILSLQNRNKGMQEIISKSE